MEVLGGMLKMVVPSASFGDDDIGVKGVVVMVVKGLKNEGKERYILVKLWLIYSKIKEKTCDV